VICRDAHTFRRNIVPLLYQFIGDEFTYLEGSGILKICGKTVHVIGAHDARAEGKLRGATFSGAYVDEITTIPEIAWQILVQRCAMGKARIFATTNPDSPAHWLKKNFIDNNPDVTSFHFTQLDNPKMTQEEREYLQRQHKGLWYRRYILGEWCLAEGAVYDFFDENQHCLPRASANSSFSLVGVDYGTTNPTAFVMVEYNEYKSPSLFVSEEYYWDSKKMGRCKTNFEYAQDLAKFVDGTNTRFIYLDPSCASFKQELLRAKIGYPVMDANNDVLNGIREVSSLLSSGDLKVGKTCRNLIEELQSYCWDTKKSEKGEDEPIKKFDHACDALRYAIYSYFEKRLTIQGKKENEFERKQRLEREWREKHWPL